MPVTIGIKRNRLKNQQKIKRLIRFFLLSRKNRILSLSPIKNIIPFIHENFGKFLAYKLSWKNGISANMIIYVVLNYD
jgi:hypothetical protein